MILDELMPTYDVVERHQTVVRATPEQVFAAIREADLGGGLVTRTLLLVRALPAALLALVRSPRAAGDEWRNRRAERRHGVSGLIRLAMLRAIRREAEHHDQRRCHGEHPGLIRRN